MIKRAVKSIDRGIKEVSDVKRITISQMKFKFLSSYTGQDRDTTCRKVYG